MLLAQILAGTNLPNGILYTQSSDCSTICANDFISSRIVFVEIESPEVIVSSSSSSVFCEDFIVCFVFWWDLVRFEMTIALRRLKPKAEEFCSFSNSAKVLELSV